jgi:hypothetical protein
MYLKEGNQNESKGENPKRCQRHTGMCKESSS